MRTLCGRMRQPRRIASVPMQRDGHDGGAGLQRQAPDAALGRAERAGPGAGALGEDHDDVAALEDPPRGVHRVAVAVAAIDREGAERAEQPGREAVVEELGLRDVVDRPAQHHADHPRVHERAVVGGDDHRPVLRHVLHPDALHAEVHEEERLQDGAREPVDRRD